MTGPKHLVRKASVLVILAIFLVAQPLQLLVEALGPAFNAVERVPVVKPSRDYLPANYTHALNLVFRFTDLYDPQRPYMWRETGMATTYLGGNVVRAYAYNYYSHSLVIADLDLVTLERSIRWRIFQYFNTSYLVSPTVEVNGTKYPVLLHFHGSKPEVLGSTDTGQGTVLVTYQSRHFLPVVGFYPSGYAYPVARRSEGPLVITVLSGEGAETYLLDLGARHSRQWTGRGVINFFVNEERAALHTTIRFMGERLQVVQTTLERPGVPLAGKWFNYINMTLIQLNRSQISMPGVVLASINMTGMTAINATYVYAPGYNVTAKAMPTSDGGFLVFLAARSSVLLMKIGSDFNLTWAVKLNLTGILVPSTGGIHPAYQAAFRLAEAGEGYAALFPLEGKPLLVFLDRDGRVQWIAYLNATRIGNFVNAHLAISGDMIYVTWHTGPPPGSSSSRGLVWITMMTTDGNVLGSYRGDMRIDAFEDLFADVHGELGRSITILCRPEGYRGSRPLGYIDAAYFLEDYETMELGGPGNPFRVFKTNEEDLAEGMGWNVSRTGAPWLNATYNITNVVVEPYSKILLAKTGNTLTADGMELRITRIATVLENPDTVEFIPSFYYPIAILPDEVDFGQVHVGEEKAIDIEMIWLTQIPDTAESVSYHNPVSENQAFRVDLPIWVAVGGIDNPDIDVGKRVRIRLYFKPSSPGVATSTYGIGQGPRGLYVWSPIAFDYPRQTIPIRGLGVAEDQPIKTGSFPAVIGVSESFYSMPGHIIPGSVYRESIYITNVGNGEMTFLEGIVVLPGSSVVRVEGADMVIGLPNETLEPFFAVVLTLKPFETRRLDLYMRLDARIADPKSVFFILSRPGVPHGAVCTELASLPPAVWRDILASHSDAPHLAVDEAVRYSNHYIYGELEKFFSTRSIDEAGEELDKLRLENPALYKYIEYMVYRATVMRDELVFTSNGTTSIYPLKGSDTMKIPVVRVVSQGNSTSVAMPATPGSTEPGTLRLSSALLGQGVMREEWNPGLLWYAREFLKPREFLETSWEGLKGFGKGALSAVSLGFIDFEAENDYQAAGKFIGVVAANVEMMLFDLAPGSALEAAGTRVASLASKARNLFRGPIGPARFRVAFLHKMEGQFKALAGLERVMMDEVGELRGTLIKWAFNENPKFAKQGWYLGIGYVRGEVATLKTGERIAKTWLHYYPRVENIAVYWRGKYVDINVAGLREFIGLVKYGFNIPVILRSYAELPPGFWKALDDFTFYSTLPLNPTLYTWLVMTGLQEMLGRVSFSSDPNYAKIMPSPYLLDGGEDIYAQVHFENLGNATAPAYNITVEIHLEGPVNVSTLELWDASHPESFDHYNVSETDEGLLVTVRFTNITLPPNKEPPEGEGWVTVRFKLRSDAEPGDEVRIYADVYFDYNPPVRTNVARTVYDPGAPQVSLTAEPRPGRLTVSAICTDTVSGCNVSMVTVVGPRGPLYGPLALSPGEPVELSLEPGEYMVFVAAWDNAGNMAEYSVNVTVPEEPGVATAITTTTATMTTSMNTFMGRAICTMTSSTTIVPPARKGVPAWVYPLVLILVVAALLAIRGGLLRQS